MKLAKNIYKLILVVSIFWLGIEAEQSGFIKYISDPYEYEYIYHLFLEHMKLTFISISYALVVGLFIGFVFSREFMGYAREFALYVVSLGQTIPPIAVLALSMSFMGIGTDAAIFALTIYSILPIARNTLVGLIETPFEVKDAARGVGMNGLQILKEIEIPYALPMIITGFRVALVLNIGTAALGSLIGAGGLGELIFTGIEMMDTKKIVAGAIPVTLFALFADRVCGLASGFITPKGLRIKKGV